MSPKFFPALKIINISLCIYCVKYVFDIVLVYIHKHCYCGFSFFLSFSSNFLIMEEENE